MIQDNAINKKVKEIIMTPHMIQARIARGQNKIDIFVSELSKTGMTSALSFRALNDAYQYGGVHYLCPKDDKAREVMIDSFERFAETYQINYKACEYGNITLTNGAKVIFLNADDYWCPHSQARGTYYLDDYLLNYSTEHFASPEAVNFEGLVMTVSGADCCDIPWWIDMQAAGVYFISNMSFVNSNAKNFLNEERTSKGLCRLEHMEEEEKQDKSWLSFFVS